MTSSAAPPTILTTAVLAVYNDDPASLRAVLASARTVAQATMVAGRLGSLFLMAAEFGRSECLCLLAPLSDRTARDKAGNDALMLAVAIESLPCVEILLPDCDPNALNDAGHNALSLAAAKADSALVSTLLDRFKADVVLNLGNEKATPLTLALVNGKEDSAGVLLPHSNLDALGNNGHNALMCAACYSSAAMVEALLAAGSSPGARDAYGSPR